MDDTLGNAKDFIYRNARLLDRTLFALLFEKGTEDAVLGALRAYQNSDGGFGNAIEPDIRCPDSQPVGVEMAFHVLDYIDGFADPMVRRACDFLMSISTPEGGVPNALPTLQAYPHAPWWNPAENPPADPNPTAAIAGLLLKHGIEHPWVERASAYCWRAIENLDTTEFHTLMPVITFLTYAKDRARAEKALEKVRGIVTQPGVIEFNPEAGGYVHKPLEWAPAPDSWGHGLFTEEVLEQHLGALLAQQQEDGGWPISWPPQGQGAEAEWRGWVTVDVLRKLRTYGAI